MSAIRTARDSQVTVKPQERTRRVANAFFVFRSDFLKSIPEDIHQSVVSSLSGEIWRSLSPEEQSVYYAIAEERKERMEREGPLPVVKRKRTRTKKRAVSTSTSGTSSQSDLEIMSSPSEGSGRTPSATPFTPSYPSSTLLHHDVSHPDRSFGIPASVVPQSTLAYGSTSVSETGPISEEILAIINSIPMPLENMGDLPELDCLHSLLMGLDLEPSSDSVDWSDIIPASLL